MPTNLTSHLLTLNQSFVNVFYLFLNNSVGSVSPGFSECSKCFLLRHSDTCGQIKSSFIFYYRRCHGGSVLFIWPCSPSEGKPKVWQCKHAALSHAATGPSWSASLPPSTRHASTTRFWRQAGIYSPPLNILSQWRRPLWLVGLKSQCEQEAAELDGRLPAPGSAPGALQDCGAVRPKANNVPTARVHILCGSAASPQVPSQHFRAEKDSRYTRAGGLLCVAVIHGRQYSSSFMV